MTITQAQHLLGYLDLYKGVVDGIWGPMTEKAVRDLQRNVGLDVDGILGPATEDALRQSIAYGTTEKSVDPADGWWDEIEYFTREELRCKCGGKYCDGFPAEPKEAAVRVADRARAYFGRPGHNVSFLRCREWNRLQGGVANSRHMYGEAMDIAVEGVSAGELYSFLKKQPEVRYTYEINGTNVHFDVHPGDRQRGEER